MVDHRLLRIDVLCPARTLIASFASPLEAWRYAALVYEPDFRPSLRRLSDGAELEFVATSTAAAVARWACEPDNAAPRAPAIRWSVAV